jgi:hypothetical protein
MYRLCIIVISLWTLLHAGAVVTLSQPEIISKVAPPSKIVFSKAYHRIYVMNRDSGIYIYDVNSLKLLEKRSAKWQFTDMDITPDGRYLFAADYGGEVMGYNKPANQHYVQRYDADKGKWVVLKAPWVAYKIEAVAENRVLLLEGDQWVDCTNNSFKVDTTAAADSVGMMMELSRITTDYDGDIEYDPSAGKIFHGNSGSSSHEIHQVQLRNDSLIASGPGTGTYGTAQNGGGSCVLSTSGKYLFYGALEVNSLVLTQNLHMFPEVIWAANDKIACGNSGYYDIVTGEKLGLFTFMNYSNAMTFCEDGTFFCYYVTASNTLQIFQVITPVANRGELPSGGWGGRLNSGRDQIVAFDLLGRRTIANGVDRIPANVRKGLLCKQSGTAAGLYVVTQGRQ